MEMISQAMAPEKLHLSRLRLVPGVGMFVAHRGARNAVAHAFNAVM